MRRKGFTQVINDVYNNPNLSFKAKGLLGFIKSKPAGWRFSAWKISRQSKDGKDSVTSGLQELEKMGYLTRKPTKRKDGSWNGYDYYLVEIPSTEYRLTEKPSTKNILTNSKKDISNKEYSKKERVENIHSPSNESERKEFGGKPKLSGKPVVYEEVLNCISDEDMEKLARHHGVTFSFVRSSLRKMAAYYVSENKRVSDFTARFIKWFIEDVEKSYPGST